MSTSRLRRLCRHRCMPHAHYHDGDHDAFILINKSAHYYKHHHHHHHRLPLIRDHTTHTIPHHHYRITVRSASASELLNQKFD